MSEREQSEVWPPGHPRVEDARAIFRSRMTKLYDGWDDDYDRQFDDHSFLFVLHDGADEFLATCRLVFKQMRGRSYRLPMEMAALSSFTPHDKTARCCEGGMVSFTSRRHALALMYGVTTWLTDNDLDLCLTTYDVSNPLMRRLYTRTLQFAPVAGAIVRYSGFKWRENGEPVAWQVVQASRPTASPVLAGLAAAGVEPYRYDERCPRLVDWL